MWDTAYPTTNTTNSTIPTVSVTYPYWPLLIPVLQTSGQPVPVPNFWQPALLGDFWQPMTVVVYPDNDILNSEAALGTAPVLAEIATYQMNPTVSSLFAQYNSTLNYISAITNYTVNS